MKTTLLPYHLQFKHPFKIAHGLRTYTDVVYVKLEHAGCTAWGEATLPPYLPQTQQTVIAAIEAFVASCNNDTPEAWHEKLATSLSDNMPARAALDMALWDLRAQMQNTTISKLLGIEPVDFPYCTYTIGVSSPQEIESKVAEGLEAGFEVFKLKLNGETDRETVTHYKSICNKPFAVDVNQGWKDVNFAIEQANWLAEQGCLLLEQPLPIAMNLAMSKLKKNCSIPLYADESCQRLADIELLHDKFDGINIKLMKCGGITEAVAMLHKARELNMKVLVGCMSESSVGCTAASHITPSAALADLDGPYLIANDPFKGMRVENGRVKPNPLTLCEAFKDS